MPLFYDGGTIQEHHQTRKSASLFDISHMVPVELAGADAARLVSKLCPYPADRQSEGQARYTFFLNDQAGIIDDLIVSRLAADRFLIVCNASCADKDLEHIRHHAAPLDVKVEIPDCCFLAVQGPKAEGVLEKAGMQCSDLAFMQIRNPKPGWIVSRTGYTGEDGFELVVPVSDAAEFVERLLSDDRIALAGLAARDTLRLEAGLPLYGQDLNTETTPMEAGLLWAIPKSHREGGDFVGAVALAQKILAGRARCRIGLKPASASPLRAHAEILNGAGQRIGEVTSGGFGPTAGHPIAFGLVDSDYQEPIHSQLRGRKIELEIVSLPFVPHKYRK